jgi:acetyl esterase
MHRRTWLTLAASSSASLLLGGCADAGPAIGDLPLEHPHWKLRALLMLPNTASADGTKPIAEERADFDRALEQIAFAVEDPEEVGTVRDVQVPTANGAVPVRVYAPLGATAPLPVIVHFHGGAFRFGGLDSHDRACRALCNRAQCVVVAVDYRLAPEAPFPAAFDDCYAVTAWAAEHATEIGGIPGTVALYGDSAGGNLAAAVALQARDLGTPRVAAQVLIYPVTTMTFDQPSVTQFAKGYILERPMMDAMLRDYLPNEADRRHPLASPLLATDLRGLPPALVITAGFDPLRDQGMAYAKAMQRAGVAVELRNYRGMVHAFVAFSALLAEARDARDHGAAFVRRAFARA